MSKNDTYSFPIHSLIKHARMPLESQSKIRIYPNS